MSTKIYHSITLLLLVVFTSSPYSNKLSNFPFPNQNIASSEIVVTTTEDSDNGDTSSVTALLADSGPDGISLREAIIASNNTPGPETIVFSPALQGSSILIGEETYSHLPSLTGGDLTIDGDIDGDSQPDITLDGTLRGGSLGNGLNIWSSGNTITHLHLYDFPTAISFAVPGEMPELTDVRTISNNKIIANRISRSISSEDIIGGIMIGPLGLTGSYQPDPISNITWQDIEIVGNDVIDIFLYAGSGAGGNNQIRRVTIRDNTITGGGGIGVLAGDANTAYHGNGGTIYYSDNNLVEDVTILNNTLTGLKYSGINLGAGNQGNRNNIIRRVLISGNSIQGVKEAENRYSGPGISMCSGCGSALADRVTSGNSIEDIEIIGNQLDDLFYGVLIRSGDGSEEGPGTTGNFIQNIIISNNEISHTERAGIAAFAGTVEHGATLVSGNAIQTIVILNNQVKDQGTSIPTPGIVVSGGWRTGWANSGIVRENTVSELLLSSNQVSGYTHNYSLTGGDGTDVTNNVVSGFWQINPTNSILEPNLNNAAENQLIYTPPFAIYIPVIAH